MQLESACMLAAPSLRNRYSAQGHSRMKTKCKDFLKPKRGAGAGLQSFAQAKGVQARTLGAMAVATGRAISRLDLQSLKATIAICVAGVASGALVLTRNR
jgi:hypothetical protein